MRRTRLSSGRRPPDHLPAAWKQVAREVTPSTRLALFADFDGTLAPIRKEPGRVRMPARVRRLLAALIARGHLVGIVSGRAIHDVQPRVGLEGAWYVGDQGFLLRTPNGHTVVLSTARQREAMRRLARILRARLRTTPGLRVETKVATLTVHYRDAPMSSRRVARNVVHALAGAETGFRILRGKAIWEVVPAARFDKARAVAFIMRWARQHRPNTRWLPIYLGDDVADEEVFRGWRGVSVAVGRQHQTAARYFVRSPAEVRTVLASLEELAA